MANENDGSSNRGDPAIGASAVSEAKPPDSVPSKPATEADLQEVERKMSGFERSTLRWTRASFLIVLATAIFIGLQWLEMRSGAADTHDLTVAAGKQADRMKDFADTMKDQADRTKDLADRMKDQADRTKTIAAQAVVQANAALAANKLSRQQFEAGNRPLLGVDGDLLVKDTSTGQIFIDNKIWNYGNSTATRVAIHFDTFTWKLGWKESEACTTADRMFDEPSSLLGVAFPHAPIQKGYWGPDMAIDISGKQSGYIVACMTYTDLTKTIYRTKLLYSKFRDGYRLLNSEFQ